MGYTHYFSHAELPLPDFSAFSADVRRLLDLPEVKDLDLAFESDQQSDPPVVNLEFIRFNGKGEDGHETFLFSRMPRNDFCKTNCKPYDAAVCAVLTLAQLHFGGRVSVSSDGDMSGPDWAPGAALAAKVRPGLLNDANPSRG